MPVELAMRSVVMVGHDVNISILKPPWLVRNDILTEDELSAGDVVFSQAVVQVPAGSFEFLALPNRIQMRLSLECEDVPTKLLRVLGGLAITLPHTPFIAVGFNFEYVLHPESDPDFVSRNVARFGSPFAKQVCADKVDVRFGSYCSFSALDMRVQADLKPGRARMNDAGESLDDTSRPEAMIGKFNFNRELAKPTRPMEVLEFLERWKAAETLASELASAAAMAND